MDEELKGQVGRILGLSDAIADHWQDTRVRDAILALVVAERDSREIRIRKDEHSLTCILCAGGVLCPRIAELSASSQPKGDTI